MPLFSFGPPPTPPGGTPPPIDPQLLMERSLAVVGGDLWNHLDGREARIERTGRLFQAIRTGMLKIPRIEEFPLSRARMRIGGWRTAASSERLS